MRFGIIIHGGAWDIPDVAVQDHLHGVREACLLGHNLLDSGKSALDVVDACISLMEDNSTFDAGIGSFLNINSEVEMDAIIASDEFKIGSVCAIQNIKNPIKVARLIMETSHHIMLVGNGALQFAREHGVPEVSPEELLVGRELQRYLSLVKKATVDIKDSFRKVNTKKNGLGTVGCVCLDKTGHLAIGVSTGGTPFKQPGRVGDTPLWGAGGYVEPVAGSAATGYGEDLIRILATRQSIDYVKAGYNLQQAAELVIKDLSNIDGYGGIILLSHDHIGLAFNTPRMAFAYQLENESMHVGINAEDIHF